MEARLEAALPFVAWARVWSLLAPEAWREEAWQALSLPGTFADSESAFLSAFVIGLGGPEIPLLLHAAIGRDGGAVRKEWMRVIQHLELRWKEHALPPDHLVGVACDALARAIDREESVLIRELRKRYLDPWCAVARERLSEENGVMTRLPEVFAADLAAVSDPSGSSQSDDPW